MMKRKTNITFFFAIIQTMGHNAFMSHFVIDVVVTADTLNQHILTRENILYFHLSYIFICYCLRSAPPETHTQSCKYLLTNVPHCVFLLWKSEIQKTNKCLNVCFNPQ